jgi:CheY-like chemotaxis protein
MQRRTKILVVDDERNLAYTLATILEHHGYETATTHSGEEAVHTAGSFQPDFLLSDIEMGPMSGIEAAIEILHFLPNCKVLFISGHPAWQSLQEEAMTRGFKFEILNKPVPPVELLEKISQVLSYAQSNQGDGTPPRKFPAKVTRNSHVEWLIS